MVMRIKCVFQHGDGNNVRFSAHYCKRWTTVRNGWISCDLTDQMLVGTACKFGCHPEYTLQGLETTQCLAHDRWSVPSQPVCNRKYCLTINTIIY
ncbi:hypothetical protein DPMN_095234 [Dreissena polymorpha]|uniref:Sushi domain-containing protein n=1 Tax=Dreissena polymorpha TaxID=45954 RepID=A0A9D4R498_DREPO|nr:hypothetical protein DPMN_095234 [Dreissena polymorpha]